MGLYTIWVTNWLDPDQLAVRLLLVAVMLASLVMSVAIPDAFGERGLMFTLAYVAIQVGCTLFVVLALDKSSSLGRNFQRILAWFAIPAVLWVVGSLLEGEARYVLWVPALILGGTALFVAAHAFFKWVLFGLLPWSRVVAIAALAALIPVGFVIPTLVLGGAAALIAAVLAL